MCPIYSMCCWLFFSPPQRPEYLDKMADSSSSSFFPDFGLLLYLEELNKEELNTFKLFLKETMEPEHGLTPWTEVKKARREDLANLMKKYYPGEKAWSVSLKIFGKMNLKDLCERAKEEINCE